MTEKKAATFEESLDELERIVKRLEGDDVPLAESVRLFKHGRELVRNCEAMLKSAQETIEAVASGANDVSPAAGEPALFDDDALA
jgi:exodeoxyribonuclease VII small subunit